MPRVRFQVTALSCAKTEDRGLLDSRSEDEVYMHGAVWAGGHPGALLIGDPSQSEETPFRYLSIRDGQTIEFPPFESNGWTADLPDDSRLVIGLAAHEEDAGRTWPLARDLRAGSGPRGRHTHPDHRCVNECDAFAGAVRG